MPRRVAGRFVSTVFIESENFMEAMAQLDHPIANVDIEHILIGGNLVRLDGVLGQVENL